MANEKRLFVYNGPIHCSPSATPEAPVTPANGLQIIRKALLAGRKQISEHFKRRSTERGFDAVDAHNVIRNGRLRRQPEYCPDFKNWKYRVIAEVEEKQLEIVVALDPGEEYEKSPLIVLVTGYWRTGN